MNIESIVNFSTNEADVEHYHLDSEKRIVGNPAQTVENHFSSPCNQFHSGSWQSEKGCWKVSYTESEYCEILAGSSIITDDSGSTMTVSKGSRFVIPAGFTGTWEVVEDCKKIYVMFEANNSVY
ncbi:MAG: putative cupin superfamily protein [Shewanella sp.]